MTSSHGRVVIAAGSRLVGRIRQAVESLDMDVVDVVGTNVDLARLCTQIDPHLVIAEERLEDGSIAPIIRTLGEACAWILIGEGATPVSGALLAGPVFGWIPESSNPSDLVNAIQIARARHHDVTALRAELARLDAALEERKIVERAKGILMTRSGLNEPDAFRRLQEVSSQANRRMADVARSIVTAEAAFTG